MNIKLKSLKINYFKGIKSFEVYFNGITNIFGENATGKTSILDAFLWLFFGKNSEDLSAFEIKPLDSKNNFIKDAETEVEAILEIDGKEIIAKKVLRQKWQKIRGELTPTYRGDENNYFWNDVPLKEGEFKEKVKAIVDENLFKLITNPLYFNSSMKWEDRRRTIIQIAGAITKEEIFDSIITVLNKHSFNDLINALNAGKTIDEFKKQIAVQKKKIKDEAESIPARISEVRLGMPQDRNFEALRHQLEQHRSELSTLQNSMDSAVNGHAEENKRRSTLLKEFNELVSNKQQNIFALKSKLQNIEFDAKQQAREKGGQLTSQINSIKGQLNDKGLDQKRYSTTVAGLIATVKEQEAKIEALREKYAAEDEKQLNFEEGEFICPTCTQSLPADKVSAKKVELTANFNKNKVERLESITKDATSIQAEITNLNERVKNGNASIEAVKTEITNLNKTLAELEDQVSKAESQETILARILEANAEYNQVKTDLSETEAIILVEPKFEDQPVNEDLKIKRDELTAKIQQLQKELNYEEQITKANERITELEEQENALALKLNGLEGTEYAIMQYQKAEVNIIESRINSKFKFVTFKMFKRQVNDGEKECCETLIKGVPFNDANNAAKINAGIDIINALCNHYNVYAPIFIDNRESVTSLIESDSQIVNLIVSEADKQLRVA